MYVIYVLYVYSLRTPRSLYSTSCDLSYHSSSYSLTGSILDRAYINQLASSDSSLSSRNIVLKASVITIAYNTTPTSSILILNRRQFKIAYKARKALFRLGEEV